MPGNLPFLCFLLLLSVATLFVNASVPLGPVTDLHRSAALDLFASRRGSLESLDETYELLRTLEVLGVDKSVDRAELAQATCPQVVEKLRSLDTELKDVFSALRVNDILGCSVDSEILKDNTNKFQKIVKDATSLLDLYFSVGSLLLIKKQGSNAIIADPDSVLQSIKALSQSDGRWRYDSNSTKSSIQAAGLALEAFAGVLSLSASDVDQSMVVIVKNDIVKLFDIIKSYDDGSFYFEEEHVNVAEYEGPLSTTAYVARGLTAFADVYSEKINIQDDKILGLARFFLNIGMPGSSKDLYYQMDSLSCLENNRIKIPLILSLPSTVLSSSSKDLLKVKVTTVFGSIAPSLTVTLKHALSSESNVKPVLENQELEFNSETSIHCLDIVSKNIDIGKYALTFEVVFHDPEHANMYTTGSQITAFLHLTGFIKVEDAEIAVLDADSVDSKKKLNLEQDNYLSLSANHLQKLYLSFKLITPLDNPFKPHQIFLKLIHETQVKHIFMFENSGKEFKTVLDFLGLVNKLYYLSGNYDLQLIVGDALMENSFLRALGHLELDLPDAPEKATKPPLQPVDPYSRFGPKPEISHIFRAPEKLPQKELSLAFLALTLLPLLGFVIGLIRLGTNFKNFPSSSLPVLFGILFHAGIAAVLLLYVLFWLKLDLFTTLKILGILGVFLLFVGHGILSHLASASAKLKSS